MANRSRKVKILLVSSSPLLRSALERAIRHAIEPVRIAEAATPEAAMKRIRRNRPSIMLLLFDTASRLGLNLVESVQAEMPDLPIVVINPFPSHHEALTIIRTRVSAYLGQKSSEKHLQSAIRRALAGQRYVSPQVAESLVLRLSGTPDGEVDEANLSPRESQVLRLLAQGHKRGEIAETLCLSPQTVSSYRSRILEKLGLKTNAELIRWAIDSQFI